MLKFILLIVVFYLLLSLSLQILIRKKKNRAVGGAGVENAPQMPAETLVACVRCGIFFQPSRGFEVAGEYYCSRKCQP